MKLLENLGHALGLELNESEEAELQQLDLEISKLPYNTPAMLLTLTQESMNHLRQRTVTAYRLKREAKLTLESAKISNNQTDWNVAYSKAVDADYLLQYIALFKLQNRNRTTSSQTFFSMFAALAGTILFIKFIKPRFKISQEDSEFYISMYCIVLFLPKLLTMQTIAFYGDSLISLIIPRHATKNVLTEASKFDIQLTLAPKEIWNSDTLICKILNSVNNEAELAAVGYPLTSLPDEYCCSISKTPMTDPVYCEQSHHRYERIHMMTWLNQSKRNPFTNLPLFPNELKRDYSLKVRIDSEVAQELHKKDKTRYQNRSLVQASFFNQASAYSKEVHALEDGLMKEDDLSRKQR